MFRWLTERRRKRLLARAFPLDWDDIIDREVPLARRLDPVLRDRLRALVTVFVAEKHWEGCGGLELTEDMKVTIAAHACIVVLGRDLSLYDDVLSILVYPSTVMTPPHQLGVFEQPRTPIGGPASISGQAIRGGPVILAWDAVQDGAYLESAHNVVIHELAHKIDYLDGSADGTPPLDSSAARRAWVQAFAPAYLAHKERAERGKKSFLSDYAVTNEAEYFAVATEAFFEKPKALAREVPDVYAQLRDFYKLDLAAR